MKTEKQRSKVRMKDTHEDEVGNVVEDQTVLSIPGEDEAGASSSVAVEVGSVAALTVVSSQPRSVSEATSPVAESKLEQFSVAEQSPRQAALRQVAGGVLSDRAPSRPTSGTGGSLAIRSVGGQSPMYILKRATAARPRTSLWPAPCVAAAAATAPAAAPEARSAPPARRRAAAPRWGSAWSSTPPWPRDSCPTRRGAAGPGRRSRSPGPDRVRGSAAALPPAGPATAPPPAPQMHTDRLRPPLAVLPPPAGRPARLSAALSWSLLHQAVQ